MAFRFDFRKITGYNVEHKRKGGKNGGREAHVEAASTNVLGCHMVLDAAGAAQRKWGTVSALWILKTQGARHSSSDCP